MTEDPTSRHNVSTITAFGHTCSVRSLIALVVVLTICLMAFLEITINERMFDLAIGIISFYFGQSKQPTPKI